MVPPIFIDMLIFECVAGPRVSGRTAGRVPFEFTSWALVKGPPSLPRWLGTSCGFCFCGRGGYRMRPFALPISIRVYTSMVDLEQKNVNTASATVSKRNVGGPVPRPASSEKVATPDKSSV